MSQLKQAIIFFLLLFSQISLSQNIICKYDFKYVGIWENDSLVIYNFGDNNHVEYSQNYIHLTTPKKEIILSRVFSIYNQDPYQKISFRDEKNHIWVSMYNTKEICSYLLLGNDAQDAIIISKEDIPYREYKRIFSEF